MIEELQYTPVPLSPNYGFIQCTIPESLRKPILDSIDESSIPSNEGLVGQIKDEKELTIYKDNPDYTNFIFNLVRVYESCYNSWISSIAFLNQNKDIELEHDMLWVNRMNKGEFNPCHIHSSIYSYVMWIKVPYDLENEKKVFPEAKDNSCGCFDFIYSNNTGVANYRIPVDYRYEWEMVFFPSNLMHTVYPYFTTDEQRISVAGNIKLVDNK